jgi:5S rRNA maturation endonuclease (ribonuclease M5)
MNRGYIDGVDRLVEATSLEQVLAYFGRALPEKTTGEHRMPCVFDERCRDSSYGSLTVNLSDPAKVIYCHVCGVRGNILSLVWGLKHQRAPTGGKLRGEEFREAAETLRLLRGVVELPAVSPPPGAATPTEPPPLVNVPLQNQEKARHLVNLWEDLIVDPAAMPPAAAAYFRQRPWLTPEICQKWKLGYLPRDGRSLFRGLIVYAHQSVAGEILTYSARDPAFEQKWAQWIRDGRPASERPLKHRYVKGYHRGLELYGQSAERLRNRQLKESLGRVGLVIVEGMNDVIRLDLLGVAAVGLCSNQATTEQFDKLERFARQAALGRVVLLPDNDSEGEAGFKELLWALNERGLDVRLGWSRRSHGGRFEGKQPEHLIDDEWQTVLSPAPGSHPRSSP